MILRTSISLNLSELLVKVIRISTHRQFLRKQPDQWLSRHKVSTEACAPEQRIMDHGSQLSSQAEEIKHRCRKPNPCTGGEYKGGFFFRCVG